jgi:hypothetical protein
MKAIRYGWVLAVMSCVGATALAHHSVSTTYDKSRLVTLSGTISRVELVNPHVKLELDAPRDDGTRITWTIELAAPRALLQRGADPRELLAVGRAVTIESWLAKDGSNAANGRTLVTADGARYDVGDTWVDPCPSAEPTLTSCSSILPPAQPDTSPPPARE